ncbi:MAG: hypothetical protein O3A00_18125 [Planctomycetota bacterium]|nr:hypothetical protein [Planctomycetota bacterium]
MPDVAPLQFSQPEGLLLASDRFASGYIEWAKPMTQLRIRYDAGFRMNAPDRAEFFYAQCGCFGANAPGPGSPAPPATNTSVDYQEISAMLEWAPVDDFSVFIDVPFRFINPSATAPNAAGNTLLDSGNTSGFSDLATGFKYALIADSDQYFTFLFRLTTSTGDARRGLGTDHVSIEPGVLYQRRLSDRVSLMAELRDWIPINGSTGVNGQDFAGNILRYGVGLSYVMHESCDVRITPVAELVGWSVLGGQQLVRSGLQDAETTIVNGKIGMRVFWPSRCCNDNARTFYIGYGHSLTGQRWYEDIVRVEYSILF